MSKSFSLNNNGNPSTPAINHQANIKLVACFLLEYSPFQRQSALLFNSQIFTGIDKQEMGLLTLAAAITHTLTLDMRKNNTCFQLIIYIYSLYSMRALKVALL